MFRIGLYELPDLSLFIMQYLRMLPYLRNKNIIYIHENIDYFRIISDSTPFINLHDNFLYLPGVISSKDSSIMMSLIFKENNDEEIITNYELYKKIIRTINIYNSTLSDNKLINEYISYNHNWKLHEIENMINFWKKTRTNNNIIRINIR